MRRIASILAGIALCLSPAAAMAQSAGGSPTIFNDGIAITNSDGLNVKPQATVAGAYGMEIYGLNCIYVQISGTTTTYVGAVFTVELSLLHSGATQILGTTVTASGAGKTVANPNLLLNSATGISPFADLPPDAADGHLFYPVTAGDKFQIRVTSAVATGNTLNCNLWGKNNS